MNDIAHSVSFTRKTGWFDYGTFPHWRNKGQMSDWSFYAAQAEQGIIWYYYGLYLKSGVFKKNDYFSDYYFHFIDDDHKPWLLPSQALQNIHNRSYLDPARVWFRLYHQVKEQLSILYLQKRKTLPSLSFLVLENKLQ